MKRTQYTPASKFDYMFDGRTTVILGYFDPNDEVIKIPPVIEGAPVGAIGFGAFSICDNLSKVILPDTVTSIGSGAFRNCNNIETIVLPKNMESIGAYAFDGCTGLKKIVLPNTMDRIDVNAFLGCTNLKEIEIYDSETGTRRAFTIALKSDLIRWFYFNACLRAMDRRGSYMDKYDATFLEITDEDDKFDVAIFRLQNPWRLEDDAKKMYMNAISNSIDHWIRLDNVERLSKVGEFGCIRESDIDYFIDIAIKRRGDCTAVLLKYKDENFGRQGYDFSL